MWIVVGVVAVLVAGGGIAAGLLLTGGKSSAGPDETVKDYLTALAEGHAADALEYGPKPASTTFLTDDVLAKQQAKAKITDIETHTVEVKDDHARVAVKYKFGSKPQDVEATISKVKGKWQVPTTVEMDVSDERKIPGLTLFGKPVTEDKIYTFPGPLDFATNNPNITLKNEDENDYETTPGEASAPVLSIDLNAAGKKAAADALTASLQKCIKSKELQPAGCPQEEFDFEAVAHTAAWKLTTDLTSLDYEANDDEDQPLLVRVDDELEWDVTYKAKDFDNHVTTQHDSTTSFLSATIDLTKNPPAVHTD
jgi:hypothetical protein